MLQRNLHTGKPASTIAPRASKASIGTPPSSAKGMPCSAAGVPIQGATWHSDARAAWRAHRAASAQSIARPGCASQRLMRPQTRRLCRDAFPPLAPSTSSWLNEHAAAPALQGVPGVQALPEPCPEQAGRRRWQRRRPSFLSHTARVRADHLGCSTARATSCCHARCTQQCALRLAKAWAPQLGPPAATCLGPLLSVRMAQVREGATAAAPTAGLQRAPGYLRPVVAPESRGQHRRAAARQPATWRSPLRVKPDRGVQHSGKGSEGVAFRACVLRWRLVAAEPSSALPVELLPTRGAEAPRPREHAQPTQRGDRGQGR